jgi:hypothetical protein
VSLQGNLPTHKVQQRSGCTKATEYKGSQQVLRGLLIDTPPLQGSAVTHDTGALP